MRRMQTLCQLGESGGMLFAYAQTGPWTVCTDHTKAKMKPSCIIAASPLDSTPRQSYPQATRALLCQYGETWSVQATTGQGLPGMRSCAKFALCSLGPLLARGIGFACEVWGQYVSVAASNPAPVKTC